MNDECFSLRKQTRCKSKAEKNFSAETLLSSTIRSKCTLITATSIANGEFLVTDKYIYFFDCSPATSHANDFKYALSWLLSISLRRHNLRPTALEFFLIDQRNFLLNFNRQTRREIYQTLISLKLPSLRSIPSNFIPIISPQEAFRESHVTEQWIARKISNFDYLMMLNTMAGRTYNDLNQYPIFPWILKDFSSQILDINDPNVFRNLSKPIGLQNPKHVNEVKAK